MRGSRGLFAGNWRCGCVPRESLWLAVTLWPKRDTQRFVLVGVVKLRYRKKRSPCKAGENNSEVKGEMPHLKGVGGKMLHLSLWGHLAHVVSIQWSSSVRLSLPVSGIHGHWLSYGPAYTTPGMNISLVLLYPWDTCHLRISDPHENRPDMYSRYKKNMFETKVLFREM